MPQAAKRPRIEVESCDRACGQCTGCREWRAKRNQPDRYSGLQFWTPKPTTPAEAAMAKLTRKETADDPAVAPASTLGAGPSPNDMVDALDEDTLRELLRALVGDPGPARESVRGAYAKTRRKKYSSNQGSVEYDRAFDAHDELVGYLCEIEEAAHPDTSYGTKRNALETMRRIAMSVMRAPSTLGSEVRKHMEQESTFTDAMLAVVKSMSHDERIRLAGSKVEASAFITKVEELASEADGYCMFEDLSSVLDLLRGIPDPGSELDSSGEEGGSGVDEDEEGEEDE